MILKAAIEKSTINIICIAGLFTSLIVTDRLGTDPVNVSKMVIISICSFALIGLNVFNLQHILRANIKLYLCLAIFLFSLTISVINSANPIERGLYGAFGRNTGLLTYFSFSILLVSIMALSKLASISKLVTTLWIVGIANLVYSLLYFSGNEIFIWTNPYKKFLGTFGNPNFISSFLGIFSSLIFTYALAKKASLYKRVALILLFTYNAYVIKSTGSIQGIVVATVGVCSVFYFYLYLEMKRNLLSKFYGVIVLGIGFLAVLGTLQIGPLTKFLYKTSVSLRGEYWNAGINMGLSNPLFGVGIDSYGTFYRTFRAQSATVLPGVNTITDSAHNVYIDIFAGSGIIGFTSYVAIMIMVLFSSYKTFKTLESFDPVFVALFTCWIGYQLQSIISINQIGLAIWGWILSGALLTYARITRKGDSEGRPSKEKFSKNRNFDIESLPPQNVLSMFMGVILGLLISMPPFLADVNLRKAISSQREEELLKAANAWPNDVSRMNYVIVKFARAGLNESLVDLSQRAYQKFPNDYSIVYSLFQLSLDSSPEKEKFRQILAKMDPYNPEFEARD